MGHKFEIYAGIKNATVNGYPSDGVLCVIAGDNGLFDVVINVFVEPNGKIVIATNTPSAIELREEDIRKNLPKEDFFDQIREAALMACSASGDASPSDVI